MGDLSKFGLTADENGHCTNLLEDNSCAIYETRPHICRVGEMQQLSGIDVDVYYDRAARACLELMLKEMNVAD